MLRLLFKAKMEELGLNFIMRSDSARLSDYSDIDAVMAIRRIGKVITNKPSVKLINAWRGGVPSILGCEVGNREARKNEYDYIEVDSVEEVLDALMLLKNDVDYRNKIIANAKERAEPFSAEGQQKRWIAFFKNTVIPAGEEWRQKSVLSKYTFLIVRWIRYLVRVSLSFIWHRVLKRNPTDFS